MEEGRRGRVSSSYVHNDRFFVDELGQRTRTWVFDTGDVDEDDEP